MLTPAYAPTATERVLPRLALDFTTASLDPRVTVARALNTATRFNSSGQIEIVNANLPRFDYDPSTLACKGLLIEETRANVLPYSVLTKSGSLPNSWSQSIPGGTQDTITSIYGSSDGSTAWTQTANNERPFFIPSGGVAVSANTSYFLSMYLETNPNNMEVRNVINYNSTPSGSVQWYINGAAVANTTIPTAPCRVGILFSIGATGGTIYPRIGLGGQAAATGTIQFSRPQWETGAFATSYIPTTTTSLTRNADVVTMTGTNFSDWYNASEGTFAALFSSNNTLGNGVEVRAASGNTDFIRLARSNATAYVRVFSGGVEQVSLLPAITGSSWSTGVNVAAAYKLNNFAASASGTAPGTDNSGAVPVSPTNMFIGTSNAGAYINGHMKKISYWPQRLINAEVQAFSK